MRDFTVEFLKCAKFHGKFTEGVWEINGNFTDPQPYLFLAMITWWQSLALWGADSGHIFSFFRRHGVSASWTVGEFDRRRLGCRRVGLSVSCP